MPQLPAALPGQLLQWYDENRRILPWREKPSPYRTWISEVMLQQTRVEAGIAYFERFTAALPDIPALAAVEEQQLLKLWEGLGYYSRARNLKKAATLLMEQHNGALPADFAALCRLPGLEAEGLFTHFADADGSEAYTMAQFDRFLAARAALEERGIAFKICHCASSAAVLQYPCTYLDMVRPGLVLYGWYPAEELKGLDGPGLEPVMAVKSRVAAVRSLPKGTPVSYGRTAVLERDSRIAVVPVGYGDGYPRSLSNRMVMRVCGVECPIVGRVCMDMCMLDVTDVPGVQAGDVAVVYDGPLLERAARLEGPLVLAIGNAPTALVRACELIGAGELKPALVIGVPVGFVNVVESKELLLTLDVPYIVARGRKGGSNVAAAICNAMLYQASNNARE